MKIFFYIIAFLVVGTIIYGVWMEVISPKISKAIAIDPELPEKEQQRILSLHRLVFILGIIVLGMLLKSCFGVEIGDGNVKVWSEGPI